MLPFLVLNSGYIFQAVSLPGCHKTLYFQKWGPVFKNLNLQESHWDLILWQMWTFFLSLDIFLWILFFVFIDFMLFSRFCKFAVNISIRDINWFVCSLKVFCVAISSFFSVRRQSTSVLYLVQGGQNVLSIPFVTCIKSISRDPSSGLSSVPVIARILLLCKLNLPLISWLLLISKTSCFFQGYINIVRVKIKFSN